MGLIFLIKTLFVAYVAYFKHNFIMNYLAVIKNLQNYESSPVNNNFFKVPKQID